MHSFAKKKKQCPCAYRLSCLIAKNLLFVFLSTPPCSKRQGMRTLRLVFSAKVRRSACMHANLTSTLPALANCFLGVFCHFFEEVQRMERVSAGLCVSVGPPISDVHKVLRTVVMLSNASFPSPLFMSVPREGRIERERRRKRKEKRRGER